MELVNMELKVLLFCDDHYHPGDIPTQGINALKGMAPHFQVDVISDTTAFDPTCIPNYQVVIMSKCDHITKENNASWKTDAVQKAFVDFVENGGGLLVTHSGTVSGPAAEAESVAKTSTDVMDLLAGCRFHYHPADCPVTFAPLKPHPITQGVDSFVEVDEHYRIEILADDIDIIAASYAPAQGEKEKYAQDPYHHCPENISPSAYVRTQGKGRVCVLTPGHHLKVWLNPQYQQLLYNAVHWCAGRNLLAKSL